MLCTKCGTDNPINRLYCDGCGAELQHDLGEIQAAVDLEIKRDKAKVTSHSVRWLLGISFVLFLIGVLFRNAYKDLPVNDIVPFIAAPAEKPSAPPTVTTRNFDLDLPPLRVALPPRARMPDPAFRAQVAEGALRRASVSILTRSAKEPLNGLIVTDLVLQVIPAGEATATPVHPADITSLRATGGGLWDITARSLDKPLRGSIAGGASLQLHVLRRTPENETVTDTVPLRNITEIKPLEADQPQKP